MKVLKLHILAEFSKVLAITVLAFTALFLLINVVEKIDDLMEHGAPLAVSVKYFLLRVPYIFCQVSPIAVLLSVLLSLGTLNKAGELTAIKAGGISLTSAFSILIVAGFAISAVVVIINETVTPVTSRMTVSMERRWLEGKELYSYGTTGMWLRTSDGVYSVRDVDVDVDPEAGVLRGVVFFRLKDQKIVGVTRARRVVWEEDRWVARAEEAGKDNSSKGKRGKGSEKVVAPTTLTIVDGVLRGRESAEGMVMGGIRPPEELQNVKRGYEDMSSAELKQFMDNLERDGFETDRYAVDLYGRLAFPLVNMVMVLVAIPFAVRTGRHGSMAGGITLSVIIGFSYWIVFAATRSLGRSGALDPVVAALFPILLFLAIGVYGLYHVRR